MLSGALFFCKNWSHTRQEKQKKNGQVRKKVAVKKSWYRLKISHNWNLAINFNKKFTSKTEINTTGKIQYFSQRNCKQAKHFWFPVEPIFLSVKINECAHEKNWL